MSRPVKFTQTVIVSCPPERVFAFRCAITNSPNWRRGVVSASQSTLGPVNVGSRWTEVRSGPGGVTQEWELEIIEYDPSRVLGISGHHEQTQLEERHEFADEGGSTRYTVVLEVTGSSLPGAAIQKQLVETLLNLKWAMEAPFLRTP
jgi:uncharacterized membrane protein